MRTAIYLLAALLVFGVFLASLRGTPAGPGPGNHGGANSVRSELEYLKAVNSVAPPRDPQLLFLLMAQYSNANLQGEGAEFFSARLKEFGPRLTETQKALYLSAIGLLRAQHAGWLREVYFHLGKLALAAGKQDKAQDYLRRSGYKNFDKPITLITPFS